MHLNMQDHDCIAIHRSPNRNNPQTIAVPHDASGTPAVHDRAESNASSKRQQRNFAIEDTTKQAKRTKVDNTLSKYQAAEQRTLAQFGFTEPNSGSFKQWRGDVTNKLDKLLTLTNRLDAKMKNVKRRETTEDPKKSHARLINKDDQMETLKLGFLTEEAERTYGLASSRNEGKVRSVLKFTKQSDGETLTQCTACLRDLSFRTLVLSNGRIYRTARTTTASLLNKSSGRSNAYMIGTLSDEDKEAARLSTEYRQRFIQEERNKSWAAGIRHESTATMSALCGAAGGDMSSKRKNFLERFSTHLRGKEHRESCDNQVERALLLARGEHAVKNQLKLTHCGIKLGVSVTSGYNKLMCISSSMNVDTGDVRQTGWQAAKLRTDTLEAVDRAVMSIAMRSKHPVTGMITAFKGVNDFGTVLRQSRNAALIQKRVGCDVISHLVSLHPKYEYKEDLEAGYKIQSEANVYRVMTAYKLNGDYMQRFYKGEAADEALASAHTYLEGVRSALTKCGVKDTVIDKLTVNTDTMHKINSIFSHINNGKTAVAVRDEDKNMIKHFRSWQKGVVTSMAYELNNRLRGGKREADASMQAEALGIRFYVPKTSANTRLNLFFTHMIETGLINFKTYAATVTEADPLYNLTMSVNGWKTLLGSYCIYYPVTSVGYLVQNQNSSACCFLPGLRRTRDALRIAYTARGNWEDILSADTNVFSRIDNLWTELETGKLLGVNLCASGTRAFTDENGSLVTEDLTQQLVLRHTTTFCKLLYKELKKYLENVNPLALAIENIFFESAVRLSCGNRDGDGQWVVREARKLYSEGTGADTKTVFEKGLFSTPDELSKYTEPYFVKDIMSFRERVTGMLAEGKPGDRTYWIRRWFKVHELKKSDHLRRTRLSQLSIEKDDILSKMLPRNCCTTTIVPAPTLANGDNEVGCDEKVHVRVFGKAPLDCWEHYVLWFKNEKSGKVKAATVVLESSRMIRDAFTVGTDMASPKFLAVYDICDRVANSNEALAETVFSAISVISGQNRPYRELNSNSSFEGRCKVLVNTPNVELSHSFSRLAAKVCVRGLRPIGVKPVPLPITGIRKDKPVGRSGTDTNDATKSRQRIKSLGLESIHYDISFEELSRETAKYANSFNKFLQSDSCSIGLPHLISSPRGSFIHFSVSVDFEDPGWKHNEYAAELHEEDENSAEVEANYIDPAFEYLSDNAFKSSRSGRTVYVPGLYGKDGANLVSR